MCDTNISTWLNKTFVETIFKNCDPNDAKNVTNVSVKIATSKGDNYLSEMLRVNIEYVEKNSVDKKKTSFIVKLAPQKEGTQKTLVNSI